MSTTDRRPIDAPLAAHERPGAGMAPREPGPKRVRVAAGPTRSRGMRVPDDVWEAAKAAAAERGETVTDVIVRALREYADNAPTGRAVCGRPTDWPGQVCGLVGGHPGAHHPAEGAGDE